MLTDKINDYFTQKKQEFSKFVGDIKDYQVKPYRTPDDNNILDIMKDNVQILRTDYEVIGYYNTVGSIWTWGWANPYVEKDLTKKVSEIRKLKDIILNCKNLNNDDKELYLYFITNNVFYILADNIDNFFKFVLYYTDGKWIVSRKHNTLAPNMLEFMLIKNVLQIKN